MLLLFNIQTLSTEKQILLKAYVSPPSFPSLKLDNKRKCTCIRHIILTIESIRTFFGTRKSCGSFQEICVLGILGSLLQSRILNLNVEDSRSFDPSKILSFVQDMEKTKVIEMR